MATYDLECTMVRIDRKRFAVSLSVVPAARDSGLLGLNRAPEFSLIESCDEPSETCARLVEELRSEMRELGHDIAGVKTAIAT